MVRGAGRPRVVVGGAEVGRREIGSSAGVTVVGAGAAASGAPTLASTGSGADAEAASGDATVVVRPGPGTSPPPLGEGRVGADEFTGTARTMGGGAIGSGSHDAAGRGGCPSVATAL